MELQWPLILFTTLVSWSAGLFAAQGAHALCKESPKAQMPALIASVALLAAGGVAVFFHLQHWERIFNGFGHITSGITQELIAIVLLGVAFVVYFVRLRRSSEPTVEPWLAWSAIILSVLLVCVMGHSYMMAARPAWDSVLGVLSLLGSSLVLGPASFSLIAALVGESPEHGLLFNKVGSAANLVCVIAYLVFMQASNSSFTQVSYYFDPVHPTGGLSSPAQYAPFSGDALGLSICSIVVSAVAFAVAFLMKKDGDRKAPSLVIAVCGLVSAVALRAVFYLCGGSVFMFF